MSNNRAKEPRLPVVTPDYTLDEIQEAFTDGVVDEGIRRLRDNLGITPVEIKDSTPFVEPLADLAGAAEEDVILFMEQVADEISYFKSIASELDEKRRSIEDAIKVTRAKLKRDAKAGSSDSDADCHPHLVKLLIEKNILRYEIAVVGTAADSSSRTWNNASRALTTKQGEVRRSGRNDGSRNTYQHQNMARSPKRSLRPRSPSETDG